PVLLSRSDFEEGYGDWSNITVSDNNNWIRDSGGTPSVSTGPASGADGSNYYVYFETSSGYAFTAGDTAIFEGPMLTDTNIHLYFQYHLYGAETGILAVDVLSGGIWINDVWSISGQQQLDYGSPYTAVDLDLTAFSVSQIRFRATAMGGFLGDIAIDNIDIVSFDPDKMDSDRDDVLDSLDQCPYTPMTETANSNGCSVSQIDTDNDGVFDSDDAFPLDPTEWMDTDADGIGNNADIDDDADGVLDLNDAYPLISVAGLTDTDGDGIPNDCDQSCLNLDMIADSDDDNDGVIDTLDAFPTNALESVDTDGDGTGNNADADDDNDGVYDAFDAFPLDVTESLDTDGDGIGNNADLDDDGDGLSDVDEIGLYNTNPLLTDTDSDAMPDAWEVQNGLLPTVKDATGDLDADGISNIEEYVIATGASVPPVFFADPLNKPNVYQDQVYSASIATDAFDANGDAFSFTKVSGPAWLNVAAGGALSGTPGSIDIGANAFVVEVSDGGLTSTATLNINVIDRVAAQVISSDNFESALSDWYDAGYGDNYDWTRQTGVTPSVDTGPSGGADGSNYYMYIETSSGEANSASDTAYLQSKKIFDGSNIRLEFQYHMYGSDTGSLAVDVFDGVSWINNAWFISGQQHISSADAYATAEVDLSAYTVVQLRFRMTAVGGFNGDIAIDNVDIFGDGTIDTAIPANTVFVTSQSYTGDFGGLVAADAICQSEANTAGLSGVFKAFLSDNTTSATSRLYHSKLPYALVNGTQIASNWADLVDGRIDSRLNLTASGVTAWRYVWTGSEADGTKATYNPNDFPAGFVLDLTCENWSMSTSSFHYFGAQGYNFEMDSSWIRHWQYDASSCSASRGFYCIEQ
ncbi:MAG: putative Ig domain-containing protein, partial [Gammaproteobacteria bacterium]|nr:putative Ig domain-containing protein [Gammaproteobacteria bacterium]